jgi:hypothetical protein
MLDILVAAPREIRIGDRAYKVGALKLLELGYLQRWIRDHGERPAEIAYEWPPSINSREGYRILTGDLAGQLYFLAVFFRKHQPELDDPAIEGIAAAVGIVDFLTFWTIAIGQDDLDPEAVRASVIAFQRTHADAPEPAPTTEPSSPTDG